MFRDSACEARVVEWNKKKTEANRSATVSQIRIAPHGLSYINIKIENIASVTSHRRAARANSGRLTGCGSLHLSAALRGPDACVRFRPFRAAAISGSTSARLLALPKFDAK